MFGQGVDGLVKASGLGTYAPGPDRLVVTNDREQPGFHDVVLWQQPAEFAASNGQGRQVYAAGRLRSRSWEADATMRRTVEIVANRSTRRRHDVRPRFAA